MHMYWQCPIDRLNLLGLVLGCFFVEAPKYAQNTSSQGLYLNSLSQLKAYFEVILFFPCLKN